MSVNPARVVVPVVLCGGSGTRLWPASTVDRPKQFAPLVGDRSGFQDALARGTLISRGGGSCLVVGGAAHRALIEAQAGELGLAVDLLLEPGGRDSAAAMAAAAAFVAERDIDAVMVVLSADHSVRDVDGFAASIATAIEAARHGYIVTLGILPSEPSTAFGYIRSNPAEGDPRPVLSFVEKPDAARAARYVAEGYLWNSGMFVASARTLLQELKAFAPEVLACAGASVARAHRADHVLHLHDDFLQTPRISIDYAVMEKTDLAQVVTARFDWADIGAWQAVWAASDRDEKGNTAPANAVIIDARNVLARADDGLRIAVIGLDDVAVVAENGAVLVCALDHSQSVKQAAQRMAAAPAAPFRDLDAGLAWFDRWMRTQALPLWWSLGADHARGGFHERLDREGRPVIERRRLRVQARQAFAFAVAGRQGWAGPWRAASAHALLDIERRYRRPDGLYCSWVGPDGETAAEQAHTYDQAFVLLAFAAAHRAGVEGGDLQGRARDLREALIGRQGPAGGYLEVGDQPFQANANMHMFEAALAWAEIDEETWGALADGLGAFAMDRLVDPDRHLVREARNPHWAPADGDTGRIIEPGHQFEWAWLLDRWATLRGLDAPRLAARRMFSAGVKGVDPVRGVAQNVLYDDFSIVDAAARLWPQTEHLRASLRFGDADGALAALGALHRYLDTPVAGAWLDRMTPDGALVDEPSPASSLYHLVTAWHGAIERP